MSDHWTGLQGFVEALRQSRPGKKSLFLLSRCAAAHTKSQARAFKHEFKRCQPLCLARQLSSNVAFGGACLYDLASVSTAESAHERRRRMYTGLLSVHLAARPFSSNSSQPATASFNGPQLPPTHQFFFPLSWWKRWLAACGAAGALGANLRCRACRLGSQGGGGVSREFVLLGTGKGVSWH